MSLKSNIQGRNDTRLEDGNSNEGILRVSPSQTNMFPIEGSGEIDSFTSLSDTKVQLILTEDFIADATYGDVIIPYEFMRIYNADDFATLDIVEDWVDIKVTKVYVDSNKTVVEGLIIRGKFEYIRLASTVRWSFYIQKEIDRRNPNRLYVGNITKDSATITWDDPTRDHGALMHQVQWRQWGQDTWIRTDIGSWVFESKIRLNGARWPQPTQTYLGKNVYWMEFSNPDLKSGKKPEGWVEIIKGNFGEIFMTEYGSGYRVEPKIKLYYRKLTDNRILNPGFSFNSINPYIQFNYTSAPFIDGDKIILKLEDYEYLKGIFTVSNKDGSGFRATPDDSSVLSDLTNGVRTSAFGIVELAPVTTPLVSGEIIPILSKNKYNITGLDNASTYEISVNSYFNMKLTDFSDYAKCINFTTR